MQTKYAGMKYEEAMRLFADDITRLCVVWTQNAEDAKDCFQNTFIKLYQTKKEFYDAQHLKAWLICVARNECNDYHRTFWKRNVDLGFTPDEESKILFDYDEETEKLLSALHKLSRKYREVLVLYYYEEYETTEIAKILQLNINTVKSRLYRGREKLGKIIQNSK